MDLKRIAREIFTRTLTKVRPDEMIPDRIIYSPEERKMTIHDQTFQLEKGQPLYIIGTGKAAATMALAAEKLFKEDIKGGYIIIPPGADQELSKVRSGTGSHPIPDSASYQATEALIRFANEIPDGAFVINMLSGGTSALFEKPDGSISGDQLSGLYKQLLESGASIDEINTVRPALSAVKGGWFLAHLKHTTLIDLIISDIPDDNLKFVGSGPTTAQEISWIRAKEILSAYHLWEECPAEIKEHFDKNLKENPVIQTEDFASHHQFLLSSATLVAGYANDIAREMGFKTEVIKPAWTGKLELFADKIERETAAALRKNPARSGLVFYGEPTVQVTGDGVGGRNQELALRMATILPRFEKNIAFLSCGTDGIDGPTDAAGAVTDHRTRSRALERSIDPDTYLERNDSYNFFKEFGDHIITGPTGNNVMDLQIVLWE